MALGTAVLCLGPMGACSSSDSASSTTTAVTTSSTGASADASSVPSTSAPAGGGTASGVDCAATSSAFAKVSSLMMKPPSELGQELPVADREVGVIAAQASAAGVPDAVVNTYVSNQQAQFQNLTRALAASDSASAVQAAIEQNSALNTPEVTQAETAIATALRAACPGVSIP